MNTGTREVLLNQYLTVKPAWREFHDEIKKHRNKMSVTRIFALKMLFASDKKYNYNLFIGDSKTPVGNFSMTLREARVKNKAYETKLFNSTDESYRLRTLRFTDDSKNEFKKDIEFKIQDLLVIKTAKEATTPD